VVSAVEVSAVEVSEVVLEEDLEAVKEG